MIFTETKLNGVFIIELNRIEDERGFFARAWCQREFEIHGLNTQLKQCNISFNKSRGCLRGMHYQVSPYAEDKLIRVTRGAIYDVVIDLRSSSPTYKHWLAHKLTARNRRILYIPQGFAHGFQTLSANTEIFYQMSEFYMPEYARGIRWNDSAFNIQWPIDQPIISNKDQQYPDFTA